MCDPVLNARWALWMRPRLSLSVQLVVYFDQHMHAFAWSKTIKNAQKWVKKSTFFIMRTRGSLRAHKEKWKKKVCWSAIGSDSQKLVDTHFWVFLIVCDHANACASMRSLVEIHNNWILKGLKNTKGCYIKNIWILK